MIPEYISHWLSVIENMKNENTYKLAWGRALVECIYTGNYSEIDDTKVAVNLNDIAKSMLKYYWNQLFFFNLKQSPTRVDGRIPRIIQITNELIKKYRDKTNDVIPVWFDRALEVLGKEVDKSIKGIADVLPLDVSWRFKLINTVEIPLYEYDYRKRSKNVIFQKDHIELIKEYALVISKLLNFKWAQLLERFNFSPKIGSKVSNISDSKIKRSSLNKYKNELLKEFSGGQPIDFYSGLPLEDDDISVDHVIPWSFMYSDDIWNLVLTSKRNNSAKSNSIPSEDVINKLKERNLRLVNMLEDRFSLEIQNAIDNNYVDKFYFDCRI